MNENAFIATQVNQIIAHETLHSWQTHLNVYIGNFKRIQVEISKRGIT